MTNEQLAILIRGYALCLDGLIETLKEEMPEGAEQHLEWQRKDGKPFSTIDAWHVETDSAFEQVPTGSYVCLDGLDQFLEELWTQVKELSAAKELQALRMRRAK